MATTTTGNVMSSGNLDELILRNAIRNYQDKRFFMQFGREESLPAGFNNFSFPTVDSMSGSVASLTEGVTPNEVAFNLTNINVTLTQYGAYTKLSDVVLTDSPISAITEASYELGNDLARKVDQAYQDVIDAGSNVTYVGQTARASITASDTMTAATIAKAASLLEARDAPKLDGGMYVAVMHPHVAHDLKVETTAGGWTDVNKYTDNVGKIFQGEIGSVYGVRVVQSSNIQFYADAGSGAVDVYPTFVFGANAFGHVVSGGMESYFMPAGSGGTEDPLKQRATLGVKTRVGFTILKQAGIQRLESASTLGANS